VTPDEFGKLFESFTSSAFRLETLPEYRVPQDVESLRLFRDGQPPSESRKHRQWLTTVRNAVARGARMQRVRIVQTPLTEYQRFQFSWGYVENSEAGEDIRILDHEPAGLLREDYWLFDDATVVRLDYDNEGRFLRPVVVKDAEPYRRCRDLALAAAVPFKEYRAAVPLDDFYRERLADPAVLHNVATIAFRGRDEPRPSKER
jgi:uncharacterized protein DUF6879